MPCGSLNMLHILPVHDTEPEYSIKYLFRHLKSSQTISYDICSIPTGVSGLLPRKIWLVFSLGSNMLGFPTFKVEA